VDSPIADPIEPIAAGQITFRQFADAMPQMIWSTLPDGSHDYYNAQWYEFTGVPAGSTDGDAWNGMFHPDDRERAWDVWRHSLATGAPYEIEYRLRHHTGQYRWTLGRALPVRDVEGQIIRWVGTCTDIHEPKQTAERNPES
jgi:PAS domain S-box-containing protein